MVHRNKQLKTLVIYTCMSVMASAQFITNAPSISAGPTTVPTFTPTGEPSDLPSCSPTSFPSSAPTSEISSETLSFSSKSSKAKAPKSSKSSKSSRNLKSKSGKSSKSEKSSKGGSIRCSEGKGSKSSKSPGKGKGGKGSWSSKSPGKSKGFSASLDVTPSAATSGPTAVSGSHSNDFPVQSDTNSAYVEMYQSVNGLNGDTNDPAGTTEMEEKVSGASAKAAGVSFLAVLAFYFLL